MVYYIRYNRPYLLLKHNAICVLFSLVVRSLRLHTNNNTGVGKKNEQQIKIPGNCIRFEVPSAKKNL